MYIHIYIYIHLFLVSQTAIFKFNIIYFDFYVINTYLPMYTYVFIIDIGRTLN